MRTFCLALDLKDDPTLIEEYRRFHEPGQIWPEVLDSIRSNGVVSEQIFLIGTRLVMVLCTTDDFSFEAKVAADRTNPVMQRWEDLMWKYQQPLPQAGSGEKWVLMERIFDC